MGDAEASCLEAIADFGDGGAFPEIHVAQYPLGMGTKEDKAAQQKGGVVALEVGEDGSVRYDAIVKQGANRNRIVQTSLKDTKGRAVGDDGLELPTEEEVQETAQRTQQALSVILDGKVNSSNQHIFPNNVIPINRKATFVRYTPNPNAPGLHGYCCSAHREARRPAGRPPMEPPKHKHTKVPRGPPSPPAPVLHSPPRKVTVHDHKAGRSRPACRTGRTRAGTRFPSTSGSRRTGRGLQEQSRQQQFRDVSRGAVHCGTFRSR